MPRDISFVKGGNILKCTAKGIFVACRLCAIGHTESDVTNRLTSALAVGTVMKGLP